MTPDEYQEVGRHPSGRMMVRVWFLHMAAKALRITFWIGGWPYGARIERSANLAPYWRTVQEASGRSATGIPGVHAYLAGMRR